MTLVLCAAALSGCDVLLRCAPPPEDDHGVCDPNQPVCGGGPADPEPDPRDDGAVDITQFGPGEIPAGVVLSVPNEGRAHLESDATPTYAYNPPASGPHFDSPAATGFYCEELEPGHWVHSLEHGYIVALYDPEAPGAEQLRAALGALLWIAPPSPTFGQPKLVVSPYAGLAHPVCVVAWNRQLYLDGFDPFAILAFYQTYIDQGPEAAP